MPEFLGNCRMTSSESVVTKTVGIPVLSTNCLNYFQSMFEEGSYDVVVRKVKVTSHLLVVYERR